MVLGLFGGEIAAIVFFFGEEGFFSFDTGVLPEAFCGFDAGVVGCGVVFAFFEAAFLKEAGVSGRLYSLRGKFRGSFPFSIFFLGRCIETKGQRTRDGFLSISFRFDSFLSCFRSAHGLEGTGDRFIRRNPALFRWKGYPLRASVVVQSLPHLSKAFAASTSEA